MADILRVDLKKALQISPHLRHQLYKVIVERYIKFANDEGTPANTGRDLRGSAESRGTLLSSLQDAVKTPQTKGRDSGAARRSRASGLALSRGSVDELMSSLNKQATRWVSPNRTRELVAQVTEATTHFAVGDDGVITLTSSSLSILQSEKRIQLKFLKAILTTIMTGFRSEIGTFMESQSDKVRKSFEKSAGVQAVELQMRKMSTLMTNQSATAALRRNFTRMLDKKYRDEIQDHPDPEINVSTNRYKFLQDLVAILKKPLYG